MEAARYKTKSGRKLKFYTRPKPIIAWRKWAHDNNLTVNDKGDVKRMTGIHPHTRYGYWQFNNYPANYPTSGSKFYKRVRANVLKMMKKEGKL